MRLLRMRDIGEKAAKDKASSFAKGRQLTASMARFGAKNIAQRTQGSIGTAGGFFTGNIILSPRPCSLGLLTSQMLHRKVIHMK